MGNEHIKVNQTRAGIAHQRLMYLFLLFYSVLKKRNMSSGAVFQLISNDGKADKMILATDLLEQRINSIRQ